MEQTNMPARRLLSREAIIIAALAVFAIASMFFAILELIANNQKAERIAELEQQIKQLDNGGVISDKTKIKVVRTSWSGWSPEYEPEEEVTYCNIRPAEKCVIYAKNSGVEIISFEITDVQDHSVTLHSSEPLSDSDNGINLRTDKQDFEVKTNKKLELETPTMDAGDTYVLSLVDE